MLDYYSLIPLVYFIICKTEIEYTNIGIGALISSYIHITQWDVISH